MCYGGIMKNNIPSIIHNFDDTPEFIKLRMLRILVELDCQQTFITRHGYSDDKVARALGLSDLTEAQNWDDAIDQLNKLDEEIEEDFSCSYKKARNKLKRMYLEAERYFCPEITNNILTNNISDWLVYLKLIKRFLYSVFIFQLNLY